MHAYVQFHADSESAISFNISYTTTKLSAKVTDLYNYRKCCRMVLSEKFENIFKCKKLYNIVHL